MIIIMIIIIIITMKHTRLSRSSVKRYLTAQTMLIAGFVHIERPEGLISEHQPP